MGAVGNYEVTVTGISTNSTSPVEIPVSAPTGKVILSALLVVTNNDVSELSWLPSSDGTTANVTMSAIISSNTGTADVHLICAEMGS
jgi:hypothetical protein